MNILTKLRNKWRAWRVAPAQPEIDKLRADRAAAIEALKRIATGKVNNPVDVAHTALVGMGLRAWHVTEACPPDTIWMIPRGWGGRPTDYL